MANGIYCKRCGHNETTHSEELTPEASAQKLPGYKFSLNTCKGYVAENPLGNMSAEKIWQKEQRRIKRAGGSAEIFSNRMGDAAWYHIDYGPKDKKAGIIENFLLDIGFLAA